MQKELTEDEKGDRYMERKDHLTKIKNQNAKYWYPNYSWDYYIVRPDRGRDTIILIFDFCILILLLCAVKEQRKLNQHQTRNFKA